MIETVRREAHRAVKAPGSWWRWTTAAKRPLPDFVIIGAQRAGTTSLYRWLSDQTGIAPASKKEVHYFDLYYGQGERWYRSHFRLPEPGTITGEASPYMLFHPLAAGRAARDLDEATRFIVLLREPVERAVSQYWHERKGNRESESFEQAIALEGERMRGTEEVVCRGDRSYAHQHYSYVARGEYAGQLRRWFDAVGRDRVLVLESERVFADGGETVLQWLGVESGALEFPSLNGAGRSSTADEGLLAKLRAHFEPHNQELFELLGTELWTTS
jgi:hypothetical protein